jgi:hypothetical protein
VGRGGISAIDSIEISFYGSSLPGACQHTDIVCTPLHQGAWKPDGIGRSNIGGAEIIPEHLVSAEMFNLRLHNLTQAATLASMHSRRAEKFAVGPFPVWPGFRWSAHLGGE